MQRLKFRRRFRIRMAIAPLVIPLEGQTDRRGVFKSGNRNFGIMALSTIAHFRVMLEKYTAGAKLSPKRGCGFALHPPEDFRHRWNRVVFEDCHESLRAVDARVG